MSLTPDVAKCPNIAGAFAYVLGVTGATRAVDRRFHTEAVEARSPFSASTS